MPLGDGELEFMATQEEPRLAFASLHSADPGALGGAGANEVTGGGYARQAAAFNVDTDGDMTLAATLSFSGPASDPVTWVGFFDLASGGVLRAKFPLSGDSAFSGVGAYDVTAGTITGTSAT